MTKIQRRRKSNLYIFCYVGLLPTLLIYFIFRIFPIVDSLRLSFYSWSMIGTNNRFIGLGNFFELFKDDQFIISLKNTTFLAIFVICFTIVISLMLAIALNNKRIERFSPIKRMGF